MPLSKHKISEFVNCLDESLPQDEKTVSINSYEYSILETKFEMLQKRLQLLRNECNELCLERNSLKHELDKLYASRSWRYTRPCRAIRHALFGDFRFTKRNIKELCWQFFYRIYQWIPLPYGVKRRCVSWIFKQCGPLLRGFDVFVRWAERSANSKEGVESHKPAPLMQAEEVDQIISELVFPDCPHPVISVIIPNYGNVPLLLGCLQSIVKHLPDVPTEYIVIDDASPDLDVQKLKKIKNLRLIINEKNLGFLRNCNCAAAQAKGQYLFLLNNDTQVCDGWLDSLYEVFQTHADCGLVGSKLIFADGTLQEAGGIMWKDGSAWNYGRGDSPEKPQYNYLRETDFCSGAAILVRKDLFDQLGGLDERYVPAYCEDSDLAFAIRSLGFRVYYQPKSVIIHFEGVSHGTDLSSGIKAYQVTNQKKFYKKWASVLEKEHLFNAVDVFRARDRSVKKSCVLIVDHDLPKPDRDAGSRSMFCLIRILLGQGYNVKFLPNNLWYESTYAQLLQSMGVEVLYDTDDIKIKFSDWFAASGQYLDYVFLSRPAVAMDLLDLVKRHTQAKVIFYGHDLHYARLEAEAEVTKQERLKKIAAKQYEEELSVWQAVDVVCYPSPTEVETVSKILPGCSVLTFTPYFFDAIVEDAAQNLHERREIIFVAGFAHRPNVDAAEWFVSEIFPVIKAQHPEVRLYLIGSHPTEVVRALACDDIVVTGYVTDSHLAKYYQNARVSIIPLRYGAGIKNKVLESLSFGVPVVTTSAGAQGLPWLSAVSDVTDKESEFASAVSALLEDDDLWRMRSKMAAQILGQYFSRESMTESIDTIFAAATKKSKVGGFA